RHSFSHWPRAAHFQEASFELAPLWRERRLRADRTTVSEHAAYYLLECFLCGVAEICWGRTHQHPIPVDRIVKFANSVPLTRRVEPESEMKEPAGLTRTYRGQRYTRDAANRCALTPASCLTSRKTREGFALKFFNRSECPMAPHMHGFTV